MARVPFSLCVITYNEEANIAACLESARFADEIVVCDSGSTDRTVEIARGLGARVIDRPFEGHIEQKNFALDRATHDWVLSLDGDERLSPELAEAIRAALASGPAVDGYEVNRRNWYLGDWFRAGGWYPDRRIRLFRRSKGRWGGENPHDGVRLDGAAGRLDADILHRPYRDLAHHAAVIDKYGSIAAEAKARKGARWARTRAALGGLARFLRHYLLQGAWRLGTRGYIMAAMAGWSVFVKYAKLAERADGSKDAREPRNPGRN